MCLVNFIVDWLCGPYILIDVWRWGLLLIWPLLKDGRDVGRNGLLICCERNGRCSFLAECACECAVWHHLFGNYDLLRLLKRWHEISRSRLEWLSTKSDSKRIRICVGRIEWLFNWPIWVFLRLKIYRRSLSGQLNRITIRWNKCRKCTFHFLLRNIGTCWWKMSSYWCSIRLCLLIEHALLLWLRSSPCWLLICILFRLCFTCHHSRDEVVSFWCLRSSIIFPILSISVNMLEQICPIGSIPDIAIEHALEEMSKLFLIHLSKPF